ncbi:MAG: hypothetical protein GIW99_09765 [Candidatus Eremiobacteraeota bacterium]|nr:hypothetical protein [Candidatus Eremiobacteraeota bacterium]MBC5827948.1 hypothetical protein [Candidatus Eremiobacteraeota bacterium]
MSLELLNTCASLATSVIVAATTIAALIQLRHLRASNQIEGQLAINALIQSDEFTDAMITLQGMRAMITDPELAESFRGPTSAASPPQVIRMRRAAKLVGSNLENVGNMVRNRLTDRQLFIEQFCNVVSEAWDLLEPFTRVRRKFSEGHDAIWEDFEYLTILSRDWMAKRGSAFPKNMRRLLTEWSDLEIPPARAKRGESEGAAAT